MALTAEFNTGLEHGTLSQTGGGLFTVVSGAGTTLSLVSGLKGGQYALQISPTGSASARFEKTIPATAAKTDRFHLRPDVLATSGLSAIRSFGLTTSANKPLLRLAASTDGGATAVLQYAANGSSGFSNGPTLAVGQVYLIEAQLDVSANPHVLRIKVDGVLYADNTAAVAADTINNVRMGTTSTTGPVFTVTVDDYIVGSFTNSATDWWGDGRGWGLPMAFSPGHSIATNTFRSTVNNGGAFTTLTATEQAAYAAIDEWPITADGNAADDWVDISAGASLTDYVAFYARAFPGTTAPNAATAIVAIRASATGGGETIDLRLATGATESATKIFGAAAINATTTNYKSQTYALAPNGAAWTDKLARALNIRFRGTPNVQIPRLKAAIVELDAPYDTNCEADFNDHPNGTAYYGNAGDSRRATLFAKLGALHVPWLRFDLRWDSYETADGVYDATYIGLINETIAFCQANGIKMLANTLGTPGWATAGDSHAPPTDLTKYGRWLAHVASTHTAIDAWEMWNEQNSTFWSGTQAQFITMIQSAYVQARVANAQPLYIVGGTSQCEPTWWTAWYSGGGKPYTDAINVHNYGTHSDFSPETNVGATQYFNDPPLVRAIQATNNDLDLPIWSTEFGWSTHADATNLNGFGALCAADTANNAQGVDLATQAAYYTRAYAYAQANFKDANGYAYMPKMFWYLFHNKPTSGGVTDPCSHTDNRGIYWLDWTPKAAASAAAGGGGGGSSSDTGVLVASVLAAY